MNPPDLLPEFVLRVTMLSDWHVGTGAGRSGSVDRLVVRDVDGLPFIPAKTLTGIWRDACEQVAWGLDEGRPDGVQDGWQALVALVFGDQPGDPGTDPEPIGAAGPRPAALSVRPARLTRAVRVALEPVMDAVTFVKPGVRIDPETGRAMDDHLRFYEMARGGCTLRSGCRLDLDLIDPGCRQKAWALLLAGARYVERLGGGRRRGSGRCSWGVVGVAGDEEAAAFRWLGQTRAPAVAGYSPRPPSGGTRVPAGAGSGWEEIEVDLRLLQPLVVEDRVTGNVTLSLDHVPGRMLLALVHRACARAGIDVSGAIGRGDLRVLPANPVVGGARGRPVPLSFRQEKHAADAAGFVNADLQEEKVGDPPRKPVRAGYLGPMTPSDPIEYAQVATVINTHNTVDDERQRPVSGGGVYSYQAIKPGTILRSVIRLRSSLAKALPGGWWKALEGEDQIGRSKKDDYGRVEITARPRPASAPQSTPASDLAVWCQSDLALSGVPGGDPAGELADELGLRLGVELTLEDPPRQHMRWRRHDSWQARWNMPRPTVVCLAAGSVVRFKVDGTITTGAIEQVTMEGLGRRRAEGFGEVALNDPLLERARVPFTRVDLHLDATEPAGPDSDEAEDGWGFADLVECESWRRRIRSQAVALAVEADSDKQMIKWPKGLSNSQLGYLRQAVRMTDRGRRVTRLAMVKARKEKWGEDALAFWGSLVDHEAPEQIWALFDPKGKWPVLAAADEAARREALRLKLWETALIALVDEAASRRVKS